jgi:hypothetical protein
MTSFEASTLGTWTLNSQRVTVAYYDTDEVLLSNSLGQSGVITAREWMDRYDGLRDAGWTRTSK